MKSKNIIKIFLAIAIVSLSTGSAKVSAYSIESLPDQTVYGDFVVGPGKFQAEMKPGETKIFNIILTNRQGKEKTFEINIEDFKGSRDLGQTVVLLDNERGPYSLKDYLNVDSFLFKLGHAERVTIPVTVSIPTDAQPGGLYGSIVIGTVTTPEEQVAEGASSKGVNPVITRIGSLVFIKVAGDVKEDLKLKAFTINHGKTFLFSNKANFQLLYENNGTIHENPYGTIRVKNLFGAEIAKIDIEPWFVMPDSIREREITWEAPFVFGRYTATAVIEKGYKDEVDTVSLSFWVIPLKMIGLVFAGLVVLVLVIRWLASKIKISIK